MYIVCASTQSSVVFVRTRQQIIGPHINSTRYMLL